MDLGLDVGYGFTKAATNGTRVVQFPSVVGTPERGRFSVGQERETIMLVQPEHIQVGTGAVEQSRFVNRREDRHWIESDEWYTLVLAALTELSSAKGADLAIVTGLPVAYLDDAPTVEARLMGTHNVQRDGRHAQTFNVTKCVVIPQPFGTLLAACLSKAGKITDKALATSSVGVIDVGSKTSNLLSVNRLAEIGRETASVNVGAWDVVRAIRAELGRSCPDLNVRDHEIVHAMVHGGLTYYGEPVDLAEMTADALRPMAEQVIAEATQLWNGGAGLAAILVTGGGGALLGDFIAEHFRHARVVDEPMTANARGYYYYARYLAAQA